MLTRNLALGLTFLGILAGCKVGDTADAAEAELPMSGTVVDSIHPIEEEIRRFAATAGPPAAILTESFASRDELVQGYIRALEDRDTASLRKAHVTASEFIHLYFPHTVYVRPPYQMDPAFIWFQMNNLTSRGISRAFNRFAGRDLGFSGYSCRDEPRREGPNRVWEDCTVTLVGDDGPMELELFGPILEREGRFKFLTYGNSL